jgi:spectinomycin phosphotransferase
VLPSSYRVGVYSEPRDLDRAALADALERHWSIAAARLDYLPVGFGSHHWEAADAGGARWFVSADDLRAGRHAGWGPDDVFTALDRAYRTAAALRDEAGLEFVLAPLASAGGAVLRRLDERYAIRVEPFAAGIATEDGEFERPEDRRRMGALLARLHAASERVPAGIPSREDFALAGRAALEAALAHLEVRGSPARSPRRPGSCCGRTLRSCVNGWARRTRAPRGTSSASTCRERDPDHPAAMTESARRVGAGSRCRQRAAPIRTHLQIHMVHEIAISSGHELPARATTS